MGGAQAGGGFNQARRWRAIADRTKRHGIIHQARVNVSGRIGNKQQNLIIGQLRWQRTGQFIADAGERGVQRFIAFKAHDDLKDIFHIRVGRDCVAPSACGDFDASDA